MSTIASTSTRIGDGIDVDLVDDRLDVDPLDDLVDVERADDPRRDLVGDGLDDLGRPVEQRVEEPPTLPSAATAVGRDTTASDLLGGRRSPPS